ncbi:MAG: PAS domain-containing protein [Candidatus Saccharibacteria bacterium]|nr:PAS domain-containing protein [Rhodoferax sp.]
MLTNNTEEPQNQEQAHQGGGTGPVVVVCDVTDPAKLAHEQAQAQAQRHFESLLTCAPFGFAFLDRDLRFVRINEQLAEMNGMSVAAHLGKTVAEIVPTLEAALLEVTARILANGQPVLDHEFTGETARAPGVSRTWNESWYPVRDEHGEITGFSTVVVDITERKRADAALRGNAALFAKIIEQAPGGVYVVDAQFRVVQMNAESLPFFVSAQPLIGRDFDEALGIVWGPDIGPQIASIFRHTLATGERYVSPRFSEQRHDIGVDQAFEWETQRITLPDGQLGVVCYFKDVTARERAETALRDSEERLRLAIAGSDLGTWHWDIGTGELDWSERCLRIFGIPAGTAMNYEKFVGAAHPEDRSRVDDAVQQALQEGSEYRVECRTVWPDGSLHWAISLGRAYYDATGKPIRMEGIALDITERKHAEAALRENEEHFRALAEASADIPYRMSADWSMMLALDGRGLFESSDSPLADWAWVDEYLPLDEQPRVRQAISDAIARKSLFELEHRVLRADGSTGWVRSRAVPILGENEELVTWFGAASDITERKRIELQLIETTAVAEKANRAKSDFLSNMSHELRTPLNSILGFAQLLESETPRPSPAQRQKLDYIIKSGWYLLELVSELLDLALIESGKLTVAHEPFSLAEVLLDCQAMVEPLAQERSITLTFPSAELPSSVCADRTRVKQVVFNLMSNAIKYNKAHGAVTVEFALSPPDAIRVSVRDTGQGLAPEQLAQLFQPFNRLGREAGPEQGTGIGLVMSRHLVELMGGAIGAESTVGVGSVFWFELKRVL